MGAHTRLGITATVLMPVLVVGLLFVRPERASAAITGAVANYKKASIVSAESGCTSRLNSANAAGGAPRTIVNNSGPYVPIEWISPQGNQTGSVIVATGSTANIPLQLNDFEFICAIVVRNNANSSRITDGTSVVTNARFPDDRAPNPNAGIDGASLWGVNTHVNSAAVVSGGGSITGLNAADYLAANRDNASRYWDAGPVPFQYNPGGAITANRTVRVRLNVTPINTYNAPAPGGVSQCASKASGGITIITVASTNFAACQPMTIDLVFTITVHAPRVTISSGISCTAISGSALDPDNTAKQLQVRVYEDGTAPTDYRGGTTTAGAGHTFSLSMSALVAGNPANSVDWSSHVFHVYAIGVNASGVQDNVNGVAILTIGPCASINCNSSMTSFTGNIGSSAPFTVWVHMARASTVPPASNFNVTLIGPAPLATVQNVGSYAGTYSGSYASALSTSTPIIYPVTAPGSYTLRWTYHGVTCQKPFQAGYQPYFSVVGGDAMAGTGFGDGCTQNTADITSWNNNTAIVPNYFGAGSEIGAWATGNITNFVSGLGLSGGVAATFGHGLSFANTGAGVSASPPSYGGQVDSLPCLPDYFGSKDATSPTDLGTANIDATNLPTTSGYYAATPGGVSNDVTLGDAAHNDITIGAGKTITLYVRGDVYISSNILYAGYTDTTVPRFNLFVQGNIYIDPNVTELHGMYSAQIGPSNATTTGNITTCADSPTTTTEPYLICSKRLTFVGAVAAEGTLRLNRTHGSLAADPGGPGGGVPAEPAEIFQYSPELWMGGASGGNFQVKSYTSLPPVL